MRIMAIKEPGRERDREGERLKEGERTTQSLVAVPTGVDLAKNF